MHKDLIALSYLPHMDRHPKILETVIPDLFYKERSLLPRVSDSYISTEPSLSWGTQKIPNSLTTKFLENSHSLTWPLKGFQLVPHQCLLFGSFVLILQVPIVVIWSPQLIDNFSTSLVGAVREKEWLWLAISPLLRQKSCMVQTPLTATINQEAGNPSNALERQVQTLAAIVQLLIQRNQKLEQ